MFVKLKLSALTPLSSYVDVRKVRIEYLHSFLYFQLIFLKSLYFEQLGINFLPDTCQFVLALSDPILCGYPILLDGLLDALDPLWTYV